MNRIIFLLICIVLLFSISNSQQNETKEAVEPVDKDGKWDYYRKTSMGEKNNLERKSRDQDIPITFPDNRPLNHNEKVTLHAIIADFQVNENAGGCDQVTPSVAVDGFGNFIITWEDYRNGDSDIYAQRYNNSGTALGATFKINDDSGSASQDYPSVAVDGSGNFLITWHDYRNGISSLINSDIYAQRYNSSGTALGTNFRVNDDSGRAGQWEPSVAVDGSGNFIMTWRDYRNSDSDIYAQRYDNSGTALGTNFKVNEDSGSAPQYFPSIAVDGSGNFIITWEDRRNGNYDIYAQQYNNSGTALGTNFKVNDEIESARQYDPFVAVDGSGNFLITWEDCRIEWVGDIYAQRYNSSGSALGTNFKVNDDSGSAWQDNPSVAVDGSGNFIMTWEDKRNGDPDIYAQRYNHDGTALGINFKVNDDSGRADQKYPSVAVDGSGHFLMTWQDYRNGDPDIYVQRYNNGGTALGTNFKVNDDSGSAGQSSPSVAVDGSGNFLMTWRDERNGDFDIYAQRYNNSGSAFGTNFKVNDDSVNAPQYFPSVAVDGSGNFIITWRDMRNGDYDIYAQRYNNSGTALGTNFKVNDDSEGTYAYPYHYPPSVAVDGSGNFLITWGDYRNGDSDIYVQRYNNSGTALGTNFKVNDDSVSAYPYQDSPSVAVDGSGNFLITWHDSRNWPYDIYAQRYNNNGTALGTNFKVNDDSGSEDQYSPSVDVDRSGNFIITWDDYRNDWYGDIYAQRYDNSGTALGTNFKVNDDNGDAYQNYPSVAVDTSGNFIITWMDNRNYDFDIYSQRYNNSGTALGANFRATATGDKEQFSPDVKLWNGKIYNTWDSNHIGGTGYDIWANVLDWSDPVGVDKPEINKLLLASSYQLEQNYPNPFNPTTSIEYTLPIPGHVRLNIYDILGRHIKTLVDSRQQSGHLRAIWDGTDDANMPVAAGLYICQMDVQGYRKMIKLVLIK